MIDDDDDAAAAAGDVADDDMVDNTGIGIKSSPAFISSDIGTSVGVGVLDNNTSILAAFSSSPSSSKKSFINVSSRFTGGGGEWGADRCSGPASKQIKSTSSKYANLLQCMGFMSYGSCVQPSILAIGSDNHTSAVGYSRYRHMHRYGEHDRKQHDHLYTSYKTPSLRSSSSSARKRKHTDASTDTESIIAT